MNARYYQAALKLAQQGGELIKSRIWGKKSVQTKSSEIDLVTETDQEVEKLLINGLRSLFPDHKFIGEESTAEGAKPELTDAPTWIIDPVDGTLNFVHGYPCVCISIALLINKETEIGIIYNPILDQMFTATKAGGAYLNDEAISVSNTAELSKALLVIEFGTSRNKEKMDIMGENIKILAPAVQGIRTAGSAAWNMATVALGGADAYFEFGLHAWDMAAGYLIIREAGGTVIDPAGGTFDLMSCRLLCASTPNLANQLAKVLKQYYPARDA